LWSYSGQFIYWCGAAGWAAGETGLVCSGEAHPMSFVMSFLKV
jgi:hypothetical protein